MSFCNCGLGIRTLLLKPKLRLETRKLTPWECFSPWEWVSFFLVIQFRTRTSFPGSSGTETATRTNLFEVRDNNQFEVAIPQSTPLWLPIDWSLAREKFLRCDNSHPPSEEFFFCWVDINSLCGGRRIVEPLQLLECLDSGWLLGLPLSFLSTCASIWEMRVTSTDHKSWSGHPSCLRRKLRTPHRCGRLAKKLGLWVTRERKQLF